MNLAKSYDYFHPEAAGGRIHIIGCGSVGSTLAENLARLGLTKFTLWDFDLVESHNIVNQMFRSQDVGKLKTEATKNIILEINPDIDPDDIVLKSKGWDGEQLNGYVFLCVDSIEIRRKIVEQHLSNPYVKAVFDFRTALESAQHYAADWSDFKARKNLLATMQFSHEEVMEDTPVSACGFVLGVAPTVRGICTVGVANFVNYINGKGLKKMILFDPFHFECDAV